MKNFNVGIKGVIRREDGAVLLLKKNNEKAFWEVPGGRIDGDESIEQTLRRELAEELPGSTNVRVKRILTAHRLPFDISDSVSLMLIYFEVEVTLPKLIKISEEHSDFKWVTSVDDVELDQGTLKAVQEIFKGPSLV